MTPPTSHERFMRRALDAAKRAWGDTHPNPMVGAVIVENDTVVAEGFHARAGQPHAEPAAIRALGRRPAPGATLYVTLEPCCTHGRTPPCTEAIKAAGFSRVVIGATDPNPAHAGHGFGILRAAGIEVIAGVLADECEDLNLIFNRVITAGGPFVALKTAATLDGRTATRTGESQWITGLDARAETMRLRKLFPAIAIGSGTALADNPRLTARLPDGESCPVRLVLDRRGRLADRTDLHVFSDAYRDRTVVVTGKDRATRFDAAGIATWSVDAETDADFFAALKACCRDEGLAGVLVEPGATLAGAWLDARAADYLYHFAAPSLLADPAARPLADGPARPTLAAAIRLRDIRRSFHGDDTLTRGAIVYPA